MTPVGTPSSLSASAAHASEPEEGLKIGAPQPRHILLWGGFITSMAESHCSLAPALQLLASTAQVIAPVVGFLQPPVWTS